MTLKDFEKVSSIKTRSCSEDMKKEAFMNMLGKAVNAYFVGSAPFHFNKALRQAKKVHAVPAATY